MKEQKSDTALPGTPGKRYLPILFLLLLAVALLAAGIILGENGLVERNAHYLCLDCMGIG
jgi:hypothetical protein